MLTDTNVEVQDLYPLTDQTALATYAYEYESEPSVEGIILVLTIQVQSLKIDTRAQLNAYPLQVTSMSRLMLLDALEKIHNTPQSEIFYCDTGE